MKGLPLILLLTSAAHAAPLLGTTASFFESELCRTYRCSLSSREPLGGGVVDFRYTTAPEHAPSPGQIPDAGPTLSVIRVNNVVTSVGYAQSAQDDILAIDSFLRRLLARAFSFAAGASVTQAALLQLEQRCDEANGQEVRLPLGRFTVSCISSFGESLDARRVAYRVYR